MVFRLMVSLRLSMAGPLPRLPALWRQDARGETLQIFGARLDPYRLIIVGMDPLRLLHLSQKLAQSLEEIALRLFRGASRAYSPCFFVAE